MFVLQALFEERAEAVAQGFDGQQELAAGRRPTGAVRAQAAAGHQVMDVGMIDERAASRCAARPASRSARPAGGVAGQVLQGLGAGGKEQVQRDLRMRAHQAPQRFGHGEGDQEVGRGQQAGARAGAASHCVGVGLAALRTMPVVAGMIAVVKAGAVRAREELAAQGGGAAGQDLLQDLRCRPGMAAPKRCQIVRRQLPEQLMNRSRLRPPSAGGGRASEVAHEVIEAFLMLGLAEAGQVRVDDGDDAGFCGRG